MSLYTPPPGYATNPGSLYYPTPSEYWWNHTGYGDPGTPLLTAPAVKPVYTGNPNWTAVDAAQQANSQLRQGVSAGMIPLGPMLAAIGANPMLLPILMAFGPAAISKIFGGDPQKKLRDQIAAIQNPENISSLTNDYYQRAIQGPAYSQGLASIAGGANQAANNLAQSLAARGIGTSGTGAILSSLTPSLVGAQQANLRTEAYKGAQSQAMDEVKARIAALTGTQGPSQTQQYLGAGISSFSPYLQSYLKQKFPTQFGDMPYMNQGGIQMGQEAVRR